MQNIGFSSNNSPDSFEKNDLCVSKKIPAINHNPEALPKDAATLVTAQTACPQHLGGVLKKTMVQQDSEISSQQKGAFNQVTASAKKMPKDEYNQIFATKISRVCAAWQNLQKVFENPEMLKEILAERGITGPDPKEVQKCLQSNKPALIPPMVQRELLLSEKEYEEKLTEKMENLLKEKMIMPHINLEVAKLYHEYLNCINCINNMFAAGESSEVINKVERLVHELWWQIRQPDPANEKVLDFLDQSRMLAYRRARLLARGESGKSARSFAQGKCGKVELVMFGKAGFMSVKKTPLESDKNSCQQPQMDLNYKNIIRQKNAYMPEDGQPLSAVIETAKLTEEEIKVLAEKLYYRKKIIAHTQEMFIKISHSDPVKFVENIKREYPYFNHKDINDLILRTHRVLQQISNPHLQQIENLHKLIQLYETWKKEIPWNPHPQKPFSFKELILILKSLCEGLIHMHDNRMTHGDIHKNNILINSCYIVKFIDIDSIKLHSKEDTDINAYRVDRSCLRDIFRLLITGESEQDEYIFKKGDELEELLAKTRPYLQEQKEVNQLKTILYEIDEVVVSHKNLHDLRELLRISSDI